MIQPLRGTFTADGQFEWLNWKQEREDARSTLDWISKQKWSNQKIIASGLSYDGFAALAAATTFHPNLKAVFVSSAPWNPREDSVSAGQSYYWTAAYTYLMNMGAEAGLRAWRLRTSMNDSIDLQSFLKKFRNLTDFDFKSIPDDLNYPTNQDLVTELKKSKATMIYGFGVKADQDSRDVLNLFAELKEVPHHFFFGHTEGHSDAPLTALYEKFISSGQDTTENINEAMMQMTHGQPACLFSKAGSSQTKCAQNWDTLSGALKQKLVFKNVVPNKISYLKIHTSMMINGVKIIRVKITSPRLSAPLWLRSNTIYCTPTVCENGILPDFGNVLLKEGTHVYEFKSQHLIEEIPENGGLQIELKVQDATLTQVADPGLIIHKTEVILPVIPK